MSPKPRAQAAAAATPGRAVPRGCACRGRVITGFASGDAVHDDGVVVVGNDGTIVAVGGSRDVLVPADVPVLGGPGTAVVPGLVDAHVHLAFGAPELMLAGGVVAVRDLGAPPADARRWRAADGTGGPVVAIAGPILTAPGGYPSRSWGAGGFALPVADAGQARASVARLVADGVDVVKLALEPAGGAAVPSPEVAAAIVQAAHDAGLAVTCHALTTAMVRRAVDAGVDELCHTPLEPLPASLVQEIASRGVAVVSTLQTFVGSGRGRDAMRNARALVAADVDLAYGTDLGNTGTRPGADPRELARLAEVGLGPVGALRAATVAAAQCPGLADRVPARLCPGERAALVVLPADPRTDLAAVARPLAVLCGARVVAGGAPPGVA